MAGEGERVSGQAGGGVVEVGVRGDDHRRRVPELEVHALSRRPLTDPPADRRGAGEGDQLHALVLHEHVADLAGGATEDVEPSRWKPRLQLELGEEER